MQLDYWQLFVKFGLGLLTLIVQINLFGKSNLAPTTALDQLQNYVLGGIVGGVIYNPAISILQFLIVLILWTLVVFIIKFLRDHNRKVKRLIDGRPVQVVKNGQVIVENCMQAGISANDLMFRLRMQGVFTVSKIKNCLFEQNGQLTVIENDDQNIRFPLISDGQVNEDVLELIHHDHPWLKKQLDEGGFESVSQVFLGEFLDGKLILTSYEGK